MTKTHRTRTTQRQALVMIAYTFVLSLGAAVPFAVSFSHEARPTARGEVRCGGYQRPEPSETVGRPNGVDRPEGPVVAPSSAPSTSEAPAVASPELSSVSSPTDGRPWPPGLDA